MASRLAEIFGTEKDRVNCPFYWKIGACRHGDKCSRQHNRPISSLTLMIPHMYLPPLEPDGRPLPDTPENRDRLRQHFEDFFEDVFLELAKYGEIEDMRCVDNTSDHLIGNMYVKYRDEEGARTALQTLNGRFFAGRALAPEFSPVTDFRDACCRQDQRGECQYGGLCNFLHMKRVGRSIWKRLEREQRELHRGRDDDDRPRHSRSRSRSRSRDRRDRDRGGKDRDRDRERDRDRDDRQRRDRYHDDRRDRDRDRDDRGHRGGRDDRHHDRDRRGGGNDHNSRSRRDDDHHGGAVGGYHDFPHHAMPYPLQQQAPLDFHQQLPPHALQQFPPQGYPQPQVPQVPGMLPPYDTSFQPPPSY